MLYILRHLHIIRSYLYLVNLQSQRTVFSLI